MYKLTYKCGTVVYIDAQTKSLANYVLNDEMLRTKQNITMQPCVLSKLNILRINKLCRQYYNHGIHGSYVTMYELPPRELSLNEKISIKGILSKFPISAEKLAKLDMKTALFYWGICCRKSIAEYYLYK